MDENERYIRVEKIIKRLKRKMLLIKEILEEQLKKNKGYSNISEDEKIENWEIKKYLDDFWKGKENKK